MRSANDVIEALAMQPLAGEGGMWAPIFNNGAASAIYFLMAEPDFSAWHRIPEQEMWIHLAGSPTALYTIDESRVAKKEILDNSSGSYQSIVPPQRWMAARPLGEWSLLICSLTPAFTAMELAERATLGSWQGDPSLSEEMGALFHD
jgi:predicted cupin superfamily sugar epimerase